MSLFEQMQIDGMQPSLMRNALRVSPKTLTLLFQKIKVLDNGCWEWMAAKAGGYGVIKVRSVAHHILPAHRFCYELVHGPVDKLLDMHHKVEDGCIGPHCVNPDHLAPVTRKRHLAELTPTNLAYIHRHRDHCGKGHKYTVETMSMSAEGVRRCKICANEKEQRKRDRERGDRPKHKKRKLPTHCFRGHALEGDNLYFYDTPWGKQRRCVACQKMRYLKSKGKLVD